MPLSAPPEALRESEERYALAARGANDGLWDWDLRSGTVYFSPRWKEMLGFPDDGLGSDPEAWLGRVHPEDGAWVRDAVAAHVAGLTSCLESEYRILHADGAYRWVLCRGLAVRDGAGAPYRMAGSLSDVTARKVMEQQLLHNALHDPLTGLSNHAVFIDRLGNAIARGRRREGSTIAVLFLDVDRFKFVNESFGHVAGDGLLVEIGGRLQSSLRPGDTVARLGGDEFAVLLEDLAGPRDATVAARRVLHELARPFEVAGHEVLTSASIGVAVSSAEYERPEDLLRDADTAMQRAKALGKARFHVFDAALRASAAALLNLETQLRRALERHEFRVQYQPIVSLERQRIVGFEALVRWLRRDGTLLQPADFIPLAEETGLIVPIGWWVLREACLRVREWQARFPSDPPLAITVNFSSQQFSQPDLVERVAAALAETGLEPASLRLEITESAILDNADGARERLLRLKAMGVQLYVDDFGTGYSALSYLHQFPIDTLKIDRCFVAQMDNAEHLEIVRAILMLARNLGMGVIAEGVETEEQLAQLKSLYCRHGQGYLFSRPVDPETVESLLGRQAEGAAL